MWTFLFVVATVVVGSCFGGAFTGAVVAGLVEAKTHRPANDTFFFVSVGTSLLVVPGVLSLFFFCGPGYGIAGLFGCLIPLVVLMILVDWGIVRDHMPTEEGGFDDTDCSSRAHRYIRLRR